MQSLFFHLLLLQLLLLLDSLCLLICCTISHVLVTYIIFLILQFGGCIPGSQAEEKELRRNCNHLLRGYK
jgi:hypothetical protein